jgi:transposase
VIWLVQTRDEGLGGGQLGLFQAASGINEPWQVTTAAFDADKGRSDIHPDFTNRTRFACPEGDQPACPVHDTEHKTWRHLDFFAHQAYLHARVPRGDLPDTLTSAR